MTSASVPIRLAQRGSSGATLVRTLRPVFCAMGVGVSTLLVREERSPAWFPSIVSQLQAMSANAYLVAEEPFCRALNFVAELPEAMPEPFVAIGDDGSIGVEWERAAGHLYLSFAQEGDEVYWCSPSGAEWEGALRGSIPQLVDAMFALMAD